MTEPLPDNSQPQNEPAAPGQDRQVVLVKHGHRFVLRYTEGEESKLLAGLVEMVKDPNSGLDWFDAAVLSHHVGERMSKQLTKILDP